MFFQFISSDISKRMLFFVLEKFVARGNIVKQTVKWPIQYNYHKLILILTHLAKQCYARFHNVPVRVGCEHRHRGASALPEGIFLLVSVEGHAAARRSVVRRPQRVNHLPWCTASIRACVSRQTIYYDLFISF